MIKVYKQKINYHNLNGDFTKGTLWHLQPLVSRYFNDRGSFLAADYVEKNPDIFEDYTKQYLLEKVLEDYPVGTKYKSVISKKVHVVKQDSKISCEENEFNEFDIYDKKGGWFYVDGVWAEKIKTTLDSSVKVGDKIYRIYPSGKKVLGIAAAYHRHKYLIQTDSDIPVTHFYSLETYNDEGGVQESLGYGLGLETFKYEKAPIFITDDGVELFNLDDTIYSVNKSQNYLTLLPRPVKKELGNVNIPKYMYNFSTKKAAEEWQENNKPKYSISDVEKAIYNLWDGRLKTDNSVFGKALKEGFARAFFKELNKNNG